MCKFLIGLFVLFPVLVFSQLSPRSPGNIQNSTTPFGVNVPQGNLIYDMTAQKYYYCITNTLGTYTLTTASANFIQVSTGEANKWMANGSKIYYSGGNVGIGISNPLYTLDVGSNVVSAGSYYIGFSPSMTKTGTQLQLALDDTYTSIGHYIGGWEKMRLNSTGLGIGTTNPSYKLDVTGTTRLAGTALITGAVTLVDKTAGTSDSILIREGNVIRYKKVTIPTGGNYFAKTDSNTNANATTKKYVDDGLAGKLSTALTSAYLFVGNGSNVATGVAMTGDASISNAGAIAVNKTRLNVRNETGSNIATTKAVYVSGFNNYPLIALADNTDEAKHNFIGVTVGSIANSANGYVATSGQCDAETNGWTVGTELYLSTAGALTSTEPTSGGVEHVGIVTVQGNYPTGKLLIYHEPEANTLAVGSGQDAIIRMGDNSGAKKTSFRDYANTEVASINSDGIISALAGTSTNWNTAYGWGNHASAGYMVLGNAENVTGVKTFNPGTFKLLNASETNSTLFGTAVASSNKTITFPNASGTVALTSDIPAASQWTTNGTAIYYNTGNVGIGTSAPATKFQITGSLSLGSVTVDSAAIDAAGITNLSANIIYDDTHDAWYNWTNASGSQIQGGTEGQIITLTSIGTGRLFLRNNSVYGNTHVSMILSNGSSITLQYVSGSWVEKARTDLNNLSIQPGTEGNIIIPGTVTYTAIPNTDHSVSGDVITLTADANSAIGDVVFVNSSGKAQFCKADTITNSPYCLAICADVSIASHAGGNWLTKGSVRNYSWNWTIGGLIYVSTTGTTGNTLTQTAPTGTSNVVMPVGVALSADVMYFFRNFNSVERQ